MRVAVIVAAAVTGTGQLPAREYSARIDRDQPIDARGRRSVPKLQTHHTYHMQMRDLFIISPCMGTSLGAGRIFSGFGCRRPCRRSSQDSEFSSTSSSKCHIAGTVY